MRTSSLVFKKVDWALILMHIDFRSVFQERYYLRCGGWQGIQASSLKVVVMQESFKVQKAVSICYVEVKIGRAHV